jgi:hypothetical protein
MKTRFASQLALVAVGFVLLTGAPSLGADDPVKESAPAKLDGFINLIRAVGGLEIPDLTGLISPENMGVLSDNQSRIRDNEVTALSGNEAEITCLSGNQVSILSDVHLFSGITVNVQVTVHDGDAKAVKPKKGKERRDSKKARNRKTARKSKTS